MECRGSGAAAAASGAVQRAARVELQRGTGRRRRASSTAAASNAAAASGSAWYRRAAEYWEKKEATVKGMLDGYDCVSSVDLQASLLFIDKMKSFPPYKGSSCGFDYALDCGAGIGRVTKGCLLHRFKRVDMVEPSAKFVSEARAYVRSSRLVDIFQIPLQEFYPQKQYDCIWLQWCVLYLTDSDLLALLERCASALRPRGAICIKENVSKDQEEIDVADNSIMRTDKQYRDIFRKAKLSLLLDMKQPKFPPTLFPVRMYCLRPQLSKAAAAQNAEAETSFSDTTAPVPS